MAVASPMAASATGTGVLLADQVYVTHCQQSDSVWNKGGYSIRAASTSDAELLKFAFENSSYELPLDMWSTPPPPRQAPRRLALVPAPGGRLALIHTAYLPQDTLGRPRSYFTHVLVYPQLTTAQALPTWGSPDWRTEYAQGASKQLQPFAGLPRGGVLNDQALTAFLSDGGNLGVNQDLATLVLPERLNGDTQRRRNLLRQSLEGCLRAVEAGRTGTASTGRGRFYLLAEPGLSALLLYGLYRLLPRGWLDGLTFSTYENAHKDLRQYKLAQAVGTYVKDCHLRGLEPPFVSVRGFGLDTFQEERSSTELRGTALPVVTDLIMLAAAGDWQGVEERHRFCSRDQVSLAGLSAGQEVYSASQRLLSGQPAFADLQVLRRSPEGRLIHDRHETVIWKLVREWSLTSDQVRQEYTDLLRKNFPDLRARLAQQLSERSEDWRLHWELLKHALGSSRETQRQHFLDLVGTNYIAVGAVGTLRLTLLREWNALQLEPTDLPQTIRRLLVPQSVQELEDLQRHNLPREWLGAVFHEALHSPATQTLAVQRLRGPDDALVRAFCHDLNQSPPKDQLKTLSVLLPPKDPGGPQLLARFWQHDLALSGEPLDRFLASSGGYDDVWIKGWVETNQLAPLLGRLRTCRDSVGVLWRKYCQGLNRKLLLGDPAQVRHFEAMVDALKKPGTPTLPLDCESTYQDWELLRNHLLNPAASANLSPATLELTCKRRGFPSADLLREYFAQQVKDKSPSSPEASHFVTVFRSFQPDGDSYEVERDRVVRWLEIVQTCPDESRLWRYQLLVLERCVVYPHRLSIVRELTRQIHPRTFEAVRDAPPPSAVPMHAPKAVVEMPLPAPPAAIPIYAPVPSPEGNVAPDPFALGQSPYDREDLRKLRGGNRTGLLWTFVCVAVSALILGGSVFLYFRDKDSEPTKEEVAKGSNPKKKNTGETPKPPGPTGKTNEDGKPEPEDKPGKKKPDTDTSNDPTPPMNKNDTAKKGEEGKTPMPEPTLPEKPKIVPQAEAVRLLVELLQKDLEDTANNLEMIAGASVSRDLLDQERNNLAAKLTTLIGITDDKKEEQAQKKIKETIGGIKHNLTTAAHSKSQLHQLCMKVPPHGLESRSISEEAKKFLINIQDEHFKEFLVEAVVFEARTKCGVKLNGSDLRDFLRKCLKHPKRVEQFVSFLIDLEANAPAFPKDKNQQDTNHKKYVQLVAGLNTLTNKQHEAHLNGIDSPVQPVGFKPIIISLGNTPVAEVAEVMCRDIDQLVTEMTPCFSRYGLSDRVEKLWKILKDIKELKQVTGQEILTAQTLQGLWQQVSLAKVDVYKECSRSSQLETGSRNGLAVFLSGLFERARQQSGQINGAIHEVEFQKAAHQFIVNYVYSRAKDSCNLSSDQQADLKTVCKAFELEGHDAGLLISNNALMVKVTEHLIDYLVDDSSARDGSGTTERVAGSRGRLGKLLETASKDLKELAPERESAAVEKALSKLRQLLTTPKKEVGVTDRALFGLKGRNTSAQGSALGTAGLTG